MLGLKSSRTTLFGLAGAMPGIVIGTWLIVQGSWETGSVTLLGTLGLFGIALRRARRAKNAAVEEEVDAFPDIPVDYAKRWPSVEVAYPIALQSYEQILKRSDALDNQINTMLIWASASSAAGINVLASRFKQIPLNSAVLYGAVAAFVIGIGVSIIPRFFNSIRLIDPWVINDSWLDLSEIEFKAEIVCQAAENNTHNKRYLRTKTNLATVSLVCFAIEAILLISWVEVSR